LCFFLYLATPLTLSEVRSMLPTGISAHVPAPPEHAALRKILPTAQTSLVLLAGACSCDLVRQRGAEPMEDERYLRARYFKAGVSRAEIMQRLERHRRRSADPARPHQQWATALAGFVAEHARNAGPSLYLLHFGAPGLAPAPDLSGRSPVQKTAAEIRRHPADWLQESVPLLVKP
jgi:hypothetical protein